MKTLTLAALALLGPTLALAQPGPRRGPPPERVFDAATITSLTGTVIGEARVDRGRGHLGVHLRVEAGGRTVDVHLGPAGFVDAQPLKLSRGDEVTVTGSRVVLEGAEALIAQTVTRGAETMTLRDEAGRPRWAGPPRQK